VRNFEEAVVRSALASDGELCRNSEVAKWIERRTDEVGVRIEGMKLSEMTDWSFDQTSGSIRHKTGRFFSIEGTTGKCSLDHVERWNQPIINQPEIGFLGCLVKIVGGVLYFLVQSKIEPGNINVVQLSPTLQATRSNYTRQHGGRSPKLLEFFTAVPEQDILYDQLQSEQGSRFLRKRNRNFIVFTDRDIAPDDDFRWLTLGQIKNFCRADNTVNMDLRTVIAGLRVDVHQHGELIGKSSRASVREQFAIAVGESFSASSCGLHSFVELQSWLTALKAHTEVIAERTRIDHLSEWDFSELRLVNRNAREFDIDWVRVSISNREVSEWHQPILRPNRKSVFAFVTRKINGVLHVLVQAKFECGNFDTYDLAPTVQCYLPDDRGSRPLVPFLDEVLAAKDSEIRLDVMQSEEGGRFFRDENRNMIIEFGDGSSTAESRRFRWMTLYQLHEFSRFSNNVNIQARSLLAMLEIA